MRMCLACQSPIPKYRAAKSYSSVNLCYNCKRYADSIGMVFCLGVKHEGERLLPPHHFKPGKSGGKPRSCLKCTYANRTASKKVQAILDALESTPEAEHESEARTRTIRLMLGRESPV